MPTRFSMKQKILATTLILGALLLLGYDGLESHIAKDKAMSICDAIKRGADVAELREDMSKAGIPELSGHPSLNELVRKPHYSFTRPDLMVASVPAAFGERWLCGARLKDGKVINKEVRAVD
jgi:hypothetical protein